MSDAEQTSAPVPAPAMQLSRGANVTLPEKASRLHVVLSWDDGGGEADVDASALLLSAARRVRSDADFVFYNQPASPEGTVRHLGRSVTDAGVEERLALDLDDVPDEVEIIALAASIGEGTFGQLAALRLLLLDASGNPCACFDIDDASSETAFVFGEVYRRDASWKLRAVGQGYDTGLEGLATDFGVSIDDTSGADDVANAVPGDVPKAAPGGEGDPLIAPDTTSEPTAQGRSAYTVNAEDLHDGESDVSISPAEGATGGEELIAVVEAAPEDVPPTASLAEEAPAVAGVAPGPTVDSAAAPRSTRGVRTRKAKPVRAAVPVLRLGEEGWQPARLFSISGVGSAVEQEKRATSALLATMMAVKAFARGITTHASAPAGAVETYLEVPFKLGESTVFPDGLIRVARGGKVWTALLEVKTSDGQLRKDQVENYLDVARDQGFDAVITLSNEISPGAGEHPVAVDKRKLRKVALFHLSWAEVLHEAQMTLTHRGVSDPLQAWLLHEFIRYLSHPRSGASGFEDMGTAWVGIREAVAAGTLRPADRAIPTLAESWNRLVRSLCLRLTAELGVPVAQVLPRKIASDPAARAQIVAKQLVETGAMEATLRIPGAAGLLTVVADLRTTTVRTCVRVSAPREGGAQRRITWLLRQLRDAPDDLLVDVTFTGRQDTTCERLRDVREDPAALLPDRGVDVAAFTLTRTAAMGTKRSGVKGAFIPSVTDAVEGFYTAVVQPLRAWVPPAPKLPDDMTTSAAEVLDDLADGAEAAAPDASEPPI
ncbi:TerD family protein [Kineococcus glutinatus]|uniref:TerD family protein n=1 Tax=Kineococcus glutinatus TaxID=1070872 RepID=A0ABP9IA31_9ACTN